MSYYNNNKLDLLNIRNLTNTNIKTIARCEIMTEKSLDKKNKKLKKMVNLKKDLTNVRIINKKKVKKAVTIKILSLGIILTLGVVGIFLSRAPELDDELDFDDFDYSHDFRESSSDSLEVETLYGTVKGKEWDSDAYCWLGVPYAKPPVGGLRWKAPQDPDPWVGILNTTEFSEPSMQFAYWMGTTNETDIINNTVIGSEDCLYLNIWTPKQEDGSLPSNLPVYFWIHGGGNVVGTANHPMYYGANFANKGNCVVVTINYRSEISGWFYHDAFYTGTDPLSDSGNFGTLDQIKAAKWVKDNIINFGGDPNRITIAGQGAGGCDVYSLLTSPYLNQSYFNVGDPLFHRAVIQSGAPMVTDLGEGDNAVEELLVLYLVYAGIAEDELDAEWMLFIADDSEIVNWFMNAPMKDLFLCRKNESADPGLAGVMPMPSVFGDGYVVSDEPFGELLFGSYIQVPTIIGCCEEEVKIFLAPMMDEGEYYDSMFRRGIPDNFTIVVDALLMLPGLPTEVINLLQMINASLDFYNENIRMYCVDIPAELMSLYQDDVFVYQFSWKALPYPLNDSIGASHGMDLPFTFGNVAADEGWPLNNTAWTAENEPGRIALSKRMIEHWSYFIYNGDPWGIWHPWKDPLQYRMIFNATLTEDISNCIWVSFDEVYININNPIDNQAFKAPPSYNVYFKPPYTNNMQYTVGNNITAIPVTANDTINLGLWNSQPNGYVVLNFSADDGTGNSTYSIVTVIKDTLKPIIDLISPINGSYHGSIPKIKLIVLEISIDAISYNVTGNSTKIDISNLNNTLFSLDQYIWANLNEGMFQVSFYANDTVGNGNDTLTITLYKDTLKPTITIISPVSNEPIDLKPPAFNISIDELNLNTTWYSMFNGIDWSKNIIITSLNGTINQTIWDTLPYGIINITFYANDSAGNINFTQVSVIKLTHYYWVITPFSIDQDWTSVSSQLWCSGSGTWNDPFIIENVTIDGLNSANCIEIRNSDKYFILNNCTLYNSGSGLFNAGIFLNNTINGQLTLNNCSSNNGHGICIIQSYNNTLAENTVENNNYNGIYIDPSDHINISGNFANNNDIHGIFLENSNSITVENNFAINNDYYGIYLKNGIDNSISGNIINNSKYGIVLNKSNLNDILENNLNNNSIGIYLNASNYNLVWDNTFSGNGEDIIEEDNCHGNTIQGEIISEDEDKKKKDDNFLLIIIIILFIASLSAVSIIGTVLIKKSKRKVRKKGSYFENLMKQKNKITEDDIIVSKEKILCYVHKGPIEGDNYICPQCGTYYCMNCRELIKDSKNLCLACGTALDHTK